MSERNRFRAWHAAAFLAGVTALSLASTPRGPRRYPEASKSNPPPPPWVFPPVWTALNVLQLWADLRILNRLEGPDRYRVIGLRALNWALYCLFTPGLFRDKSPIAGEAVALAEGATTGATVALLAREDPLAAAALVPLTLWTGYASLLGVGGVAAHNPDRLLDDLRWSGAF